MKQGYLNYNQNIQLPKCFPHCHSQIDNQYTRSILAKHGKEQTTKSPKQSLNGKTIHENADLNSQVAKHLHSKPFKPTRNAIISEAGVAEGKVLFLDSLTAGVAGDMFVSALYDLGVPLKVLLQGLDSFNLSGYQLDISQSEKSGIVAPKFTVHTDPSQPLRTYATIRDLITQSTLPPAAKDLAQKCFLLLGKAEARCHNQDLDSVHFHEVGAVDSIVDIICVCNGVAWLNPGNIVASPLPMGRGVIQGAAHGPLPNPPPATLAVCEQARIPTVGDVHNKELVTPTGACLIGGLAQQFDRWPSIVPDRAAYGSGSRDLAHAPNQFRIVMGQSCEVMGSEGGSGGSMSETGNSMGHVHTHGHMHSHDHVHSHSHEHGHTHGHQGEHEHAHDHGHKHNHAHDHGHKNKHAHDHGHEHNHTHDHSHKHKHAQNNEPVQLHEREPVHEHKHEHYHQGHKHTHKHESLDS